jgi:hypothetical protein
MEAKSIRSYTSLNKEFMKKCIEYIAEKNFREDASMRLGMLSH